jgi:hypothetical protein
MACMSIYLSHDINTAPFDTTILNRTLDIYCLFIVGSSSMTARYGRLDEPTASSSSSTISPLCMLSLGRDVGLRKAETSLTLLLLGLHSVDKEVRAGDAKNCSCFFLLSLTSACHCFITMAI